MKMILPVLFSSIVCTVQICQAQQMQIIQPSSGSVCQKDNLCATKNSCPFWKKKDKERIETTSSSAKGRLLQELKSAICNKGERALCCPPLDLADSPNKSCPSSSECATRDSCTFWKDKFAILKQLKVGSQQHTDLRSEIVSAVCNKKKKALCCPLDYVPRGAKPINDSPDYLPVEGECGLTGDSRRVFGGKETEPGDYPFAALLGQSVLRPSQIYIGGTRAPATKQPSWVCAGTLINYWYVVTAAHCIGAGSKRISHLRLGEWEVGNFGSGSAKIDRDGFPPVQEFRITPSDIVVHENYKKKFRNIENDIALIRLPRKAKLNFGVQFACLPIPGTEDIAEVNNWNSGVDGKEATVIGWGYSCYKNNSREFCKDQYIGNKKQQYLEVPVLGGRGCADHSLTITDDQVCAGGEEGKGSCKGDSGGGLFIRKTSKVGNKDDKKKENRPWFLLGVVSYGKPTCGVGTPEVYTRVSRYVDWIRRNINK